MHTMRPRQPHTPHPGKSASACRTRPSPRPVWSPPVIPSRAPPPYPLSACLFHARDGAPRLWSAARLASGPAFRFRAASCNGQRTRCAGGSCVFHGRGGMGGRSCMWPPHALQMLCRCVLRIFRGGIAYRLAVGDSNCFLQNSPSCF